MEYHGREVRLQEPREILGTVFYRCVCVALWQQYDNDSSTP